MKKILAVLVTVCAIGCSGNVHPRQSGDNIVTPASPHDMTNDQLRNKIVKAGSSWTIVDTEDVLGVNLNIKPKR